MTPPTDEARAGEPRTEAGRALLSQWTRHNNPMADEIRAAILAIEREAAEEGMLRQLERQLAEEQNPRPSVMVGPAPSLDVERLAGWLKEDYAAEAATSGGNPFSTRRPHEFVATRLLSRLSEKAP